MFNMNTGMLPEVKVGTTTGVSKGIWQDNGTRWGVSEGMSEIRASRS